jgi:hypothetical protein
MLQQQHEAAREIHNMLKDHIEYYAVKEAMKEALIRAGPSTGLVKSVMERHLAHSGLGKQLLDLAFSVKERLLLPYDGVSSSGASSSPSELWHIAVCCSNHPSGQ